MTRVVRAYVFLIHTWIIRLLFAALVTLAVLRSKRVILTGDMPRGTRELESVHVILPIGARRARLPWTAWEKAPCLLLDSLISSFFIAKDITRSCVAFHGYHRNRLRESGSSRRGIR